MHGYGESQKGTGAGGPRVAKVTLVPKRRLSKAKRVARDNATRGSAPMSLPEFAAGYRRLGG